MIKTRLKPVYYALHMVAWYYRNGKLKLPCCFGWYTALTWLMHFYVQNQRTFLSFNLESVCSAPRPIADTTSESTCIKYDCSVIEASPWSVPSPEGSVCIMLIWLEKKCFTSPINVCRWLWWCVCVYKSERLCIESLEGDQHLTYIRTVGFA